MSPASSPPRIPSWLKHNFGASRRHLSGCTPYRDSSLTSLLPPYHSRRTPQSSKTCTCTAAASFPLSAETQFLNPRAHSFPRRPSKRQERTPRQFPTDPAPFSLTGLLPRGGLECRRKPCAPSLLRPRLPLPPAPPRSPGRGGRAVLGCAQGATRGRRAGRPGLGPRGTAPPTRKNSPKAAAAAT